MLFIKKIMLVLLLTLITQPLLAAENEWAITIATISEVEEYEDKFAYVITYDAPESTAVNAEGEKIVGPIEQMGLIEKEPIVGQKLKIRYMRDEPIIFEAEEPMQFEEGA